ncbi:MAG: glycosyltransferase family 2 protein [Methanomicrobiales archaeon]|nr:glycosyltransferase family 2 protein [Methanomicrobiales archaeon]MDI6875349.1 glycosyltransferase family 2 protein [Methanomicrobiales archaeon]
MTVRETDCTLVVPAYNEERRIHHLLSEELVRFTGEIILVCDGTDDTAAVAEEFARSQPALHLRCLSFRERQGKGGAVIAGLREAERPYVGFMDADGSTSLREMKRLFAGLEKYDGLIGSRWLPESVIPEPQPLTRRLQSRLFNLLVRVIFSLPYSDTQCGAKAFRMTALRDILPAVRSRGFTFDVELLWRMRQKGCRVGELAIEWSNRGESKVGGSDGIRMFKELLEIRFGR